MRVRKDVIIVAVVRGKNNTREWNTSSVKTVKICDNRITLRLEKILKLTLYLQVEERM